MIARCVLSECVALKEGVHVITGQTVKGCGCGLAAKTLSPTSRCPWVNGNI